MSATATKPKPTPLIWAPDYPTDYRDEALSVATKALDPAAVVEDTVALIGAIDDELQAAAERYAKNAFPPAQRVRGFLADAVSLLRRREAYVARLGRLASIHGAEVPAVAARPVADAVHKLGLAARPEFGTDLRAVADEIRRDASERLRIHNDRHLDDLLSKYDTASNRPIGVHPWLDDALAELEPALAERDRLDGILAAHDGAWAEMSDAQVALCKEAVEKAGGNDTVAGQLRAVRRLLTSFWKASSGHVELENARKAVQAVRDRISAVGNDPGAKVLLDSLKGELKVTEKVLADVEARCLDEITEGLKALVGRVAAGDGPAREELIREANANPNAFKAGLGEDLARSWQEALLPLVGFVVANQGGGR